MEMTDVSVQDVMTHKVVMLNPSDTVHEAAQKLARNRISGAPVVEDRKVVGIVSESDLIHAVMPPVPVDRGASILELLTVIGRARPRSHQNKTSVAEVMSSMVIQISPESSIWSAASVMERRGVKRLPVVDNEDHLLGIVSRADLVKAIAKDDDKIRTDAIEAINVLGEESFADLVVEVADGVATISGRADRKSTRELAIRLASRTPGVVEVISRLNYDVDDTRPKSFQSERDPKDPRLDWRSTSAVNQGPR
jgi:CBS domain-containing protein